MSRSNDTESEWNRCRTLQLESCFTKLQQKWKKRERTDLLLLSEDGEEIAVHKLILSASSDFFSDMFQPTFEESANKEVKLKPIKGRLLRLILNHIYAVDFNNVNMNCDYDDLLALLDVANYLQLVALANFCSVQLGKLININNFVHLWNTNELYKNETLQNCLLQRFVDLQSQFLEQETFLNFGMDLMNVAINKCKNNVNPYILVEALLRWVKRDEKRIVQLPSIFSNIDTRRLEPKFVDNLVNNEEVVKQCPEVLLQLLNPKNDDTSLEQILTEPNSAVVILLLFGTDRSNHQSFVQHIDFSGKSTQVVYMPFNLVDDMCFVQYKKNVYFVGGDPKKTGADYKTFVEYDVKKNLAYEREPILKAVKTPVAKVIKTDLYLIGKDPFNSYLIVQYYDFLNGGHWMEVTCTTFNLHDIHTYVPFQHSLLVMKSAHNGQADEIAVLSRTVVNTHKCAVPFYFSAKPNEMIPFDKEIWCFDCALGRKCIYNVIEEEIVVKRCKIMDLNNNIFIFSIPVLDHANPCVITFDKSNNVAKLWNFKEETELANIVFGATVNVNMMMAYCANWP